MCGLCCVLLGLALYPTVMANVFLDKSGLSPTYYSHHIPKHHISSGSAAAAAAAAAAATATAVRDLLRGKRPSNVDGHSFCQSWPCQNQGTCVDTAEGYVCRCPSSFSGPNCDHSRVSVDRDDRRNEITNCNGMSLMTRIVADSGEWWYGGPRTPCDLVRQVPIQPEILSTANKMVVNVDLRRVSNNTVTNMNIFIPTLTDTALNEQPVIYLQCNTIRHGQKKLQLYIRPRSEAGGLNMYRLRTEYGGISCYRTDITNCLDMSMLGGSIQLTVETCSTCGIDLANGAVPVIIFDMNNLSNPNCVSPN